MYSVPRYHILIVATYLALVVVLAVTTFRAAPAGNRPAVRPCANRTSGAVALLGTGLLVWLVPSFSYIPAPAKSNLLISVGFCAALAALAVASPWRRGPDVALLLSAACYTATTAVLIRLDPAPRIDVWYTLQGAADGLAHLDNLYTQILVGPPGRMEAFTYLPWTAVMLAPGRWFGGDVRWALAVVTLCTAAGFVALADRGRRPRGAAGFPTGGDEDQRAARVAACLLLLLPGTLTQVEQAWTEPLLLGCLTAAVLAVSRGSDRWAVLALAVALASKQHIVLLLPVFAAWPRFGPRRTAAAAGTAGLLVFPWYFADPEAMWHDTVQLLAGFHPIRFADTAYLALMNEFGVEPPFWLTGAVVLTALAVAAVLVHRRDPGMDVVLRWCALVLFVASFVNKQAFYNQYWLVGGLVLASWAVPADRGRHLRHDPPEVRGPAGTAARPADAAG